MLDSKSRNKPLICIAESKDAKDCEKLAASVSLQKLQNAGKSYQDSGFLVSAFRAKDYANFINVAEHFLILRSSENTMIGFLLAYESEQINPCKEELNMHIKTNICEKFVLIKQICISSDIQYRRKGYASSLYKELYRRIHKDYRHEPEPRPIYAAIVKEPDNPVSLSFHYRLGFCIREEFIPKLDRRPRYIFENKTPGTPETEHCSSSTGSPQYPLRTKEGAQTRLQVEDFPRTGMKLDRNEPLIRIAMPNDAQDCHSLAESMSLQNLQKTGKHVDTGFLVSGYQAREYARFVNDAEHFLVLHSGNTLVGFLLACASESLDDNADEVKLHIKSNMSEKFVLIKEICISPELQYRRRGFATLLYKELYARIQHYYDHETAPRPIYAVIARETPNPVSRKFHRKMEFVKRAEFVSNVDARPAYIYENRHPGVALDKMTDEETRMENCPFYDSRAMMDPHCVGIGITMYAIGQPDVAGNFHSNVRTMLKWRHPGIENIYPRVDDCLARTVIDFDDYKKSPRTLIRLPRYDLNKHEVEQMASYAYIDKNDPHDVITWQQVLRGTFISGLRDLSSFPADVQKLQLIYRMWDNDPDDRCRYFRQLHYADNTPWQLCMKRQPKSVSFKFLAPKAEIDVYKESQTSRYTFTVSVVRETKFYLRTVALPMMLITSLNFASAGFDDFQDQAGFNASLLLTTVAYLFITKDVTPQTNEITKLDIVTYTALLLSWVLIIFRFLSISEFPSEAFLDTEKRISIGIAFLVVAVQSSLYLYLYVKYHVLIRGSPHLGEIKS